MNAHHHTPLHGRHVYRGPTLYDTVDLYFEHYALEDVPCEFDDTWSWAGTQHMHDIDVRLCSSELVWVQIGGLKLDRYMLAQMMTTAEVEALEAARSERMTEAGE